MGALLNAIGVPEGQQATASQDLLTAEQLVLALQIRFEEVNTEQQKDALATPIVELTRLLHAEAFGIPIS